MIDLSESTRRVAAVVRGVTDDQLGSPTPCGAMPVGLLLAHLHGLSIAFRDAARKIDGPTTRTPPDPGRLELSEQWRELIPARLGELAAAWNETGAWTGTTAAGGVSLSAEEAGLVALDEVVLHGWDLAVATGQDYDVEPDALLAVEAFCASIPDEPDARNGLFGPRVAVGEDASRFDHVLGLAGRDPRWRPPEGGRR
ncbi:MAG: TIGR03086 family metal-binding protein [Micrococcus sp.]|nr:TIGR03086 family metal-binding protein [Micrococcus sp.]